MAECKRCGVDSDELIAKLKRHVENLDALLWEMELQDWRK